MEIFSVEKLGFEAYDYSESNDNSLIKILENNSFKINSGEFAVLCGETGCGKSTLIKLLKPEVAPVGNTTGKVYYCGRELADYEEKDISAEIGYVSQNPEHQCVTDKVWHELAFGLENLGLDKQSIRRRVAEMSAYFDMEDWYDKNVDELSGGQKQILALASVMIMRPKILLLDEPTSQLDPIASAEFLQTLAKLNKEFGITILLVEHRLEEVLPIADKIIIMNKGHICYEGNVRDVLKKENVHHIPKQIINALPCAMQVFEKIGKKEDEVPVSIVEGKEFLFKKVPHKMFYKKDNNKKEDNENKEIVLEIKEAWYRYDKKGLDVLRGLNLRLYNNEILCLLGGNGSGKTTALKCLAGLNNIYSGKVMLKGKKIKGIQREIAMLPQDVETLLVADTVKRELELAGAEGKEFPFDLKPYYERHPYDLSGGEKQMLALAKVMAKDASIVLMDEPAKGLDKESCDRLIDFIHFLKKKGKTVLIVTHDVEFAALCADRCAFFFRGEIVAEDNVSKFFEENTFYTTAASRMSKDIFENVITTKDLLDRCSALGGIE